MPDARVYEAEERSGRHLAESYVAPLLQMLFPDLADGGEARAGTAPFRALSLGCGVGADVEALTDLGYPCYGIDAGARRSAWKKRRQPERLFLSNARFLPFEDGAFDFVLVGCLIPHIGVYGDTCAVRPRFREERNEAFDEAVRVLRPGGWILMSSPNRQCPLDLFHRPDPWRHLPRVHSPRESFLLSYGDYERALVGRCGCRNMQALPLEGYWGFYRSREYAIGRLLQLPTRAFLKLLSWRPARLLRRSFINPWLVVLAQK